MDWFLAHKLASIAKRGNPDPAFVRALEKKLRLESGHRLWWLRWGRVAAGSFSALILASSATTVYAYESDDVMPDHPLYALRQSVEGIEMSAATDPVAKAEVQVKHLKRRLREVELLQKKKKLAPEKNENDFEEHLEQAVKDTDQLPEKAKSIITQKLQHVEREHLDMLITSRNAAKTDEERKNIQDLIKQERQKVRFEHKQNRQEREQARQDQDKKNSDIKKPND